MNGNSKCILGGFKQGFSFSIFLDSVVILIIFNNYREVRRRRQQEKNALEAKVQEMKKKDVEAEEWKRQKQFFYEKFWTFGLGLSMLVVAGSYYWMRGWDQTYINIITPSHISKEDEKNLTLEKTKQKQKYLLSLCIVIFEEEPKKRSENTKKNKDFFFIFKFLKFIETYLIVNFIWLFLKRKVTKNVLIKISIIKRKRKKKDNKVYIINKDMRDCKNDWEKDWKQINESISLLIYYIVNKLVITLVLLLIYL